MSAYAVTELDKGILINTVSDTRRGAMVNWLYAYKFVQVLATWTDEQIERSWDFRSGGNQLAQVIEVHVIPRIVEGEQT